MKTEEQREHNQELACLVDDIAFKASLLRIAEKALEDIRGLCVSSTYWNNPDYPNCARLLKQHHKIVSDAKVKAEEMRAIEYGDDVEVPIREHSQEMYIWEIRFLKEDVKRLYAEIDEKRCCMQLKDAEED